MQIEGESLIAELERQAGKQPWLGVPHGEGVLHFEIPGLLLCLPIASVSRVILLAAVQPLPSAPSFVRGLLNLHGSLIPVIDLAGRLGYPLPSRYPSETPMLYCVDGARAAALVVHRVLGPATVGADGSRMATVSEASDSPFLGALPMDHRMSLLLDLGTLLNLDIPLDRSPAPVLDRGAESLLCSSAP